ncbi:MAG: type II toxin-antitoxin system RelE/ParE family toxin [Nitrospira sp. SB0677_bin_15]|nr:type II toxin-antitoxin system RelE/ParE family toxin [Nitrospira sp. SB0667_bin_9]MYD30080.1 type II toxin-antitoxin system RelE/ParE family toxin [Nitrospira sp. SB0661_bin_20]MYG40530.1 type II toxin-antitoxin system RelE/ParE family toxin [Nitrospira sp. SB0677_bin_15]MYJ22416.1 type II toxin-antitoxin system RelE/ParE family toxin [Nitrospira sp. SB0673_bin_12]
MIKSFADKRTAAIFVGLSVRSLPMRVQRHARTKLLIIEAATRLDDLRIPPGNRLEVLKGERQGQYSIRINKQWRVCFVWRNGEAWHVEIVDCH